MQVISKKQIWGIVLAVVAVAVALMSSALFEDADKSKNYVCQMPITGEYRVWADGGLQGQWFGTVEVYDKTSQIDFSGIEKDNKGNYYAVGNNPAAALTFNDKGKGFIIGSFRVVLPTDDANMSKIQRDFGSANALIATLVRPTLYKVVTACGPLMSSLESVSETRTDLTAYITDQLNNGIYKTRTVKTEVKNELTGEMELRSQAMIVEDMNAPGGYKRQEVSPFSQYGISCGLVSIIDIKYDAATQDQIDAQKQANLAVITSKTKSIEAMQRTIQITEEGKAATEKAKWEQEQVKIVAVTKAEQEYEVARLEALKAAEEAKKIKAQGEAEAAAARAKVSAGLSPSEKAEWDYKTKVGIAEAFAKTVWPKVVMTGDAGKGGNNAMDVIALERMIELTNKISK